MTATSQTLPTSMTVTPGTGPRATAADTTEQLLAEVRRIGPILRENAGAAEQNRRLPKAVIDALIAAGLERLLTPASLGGFELDPASSARIVEEVALYDSAAAWALQSGNVSAWWARNLPEKGMTEILGNNPSAMVAAAFHPQQRAVEVPGGYRLTGRSPLASMIHDSDRVLVSAFVFDGDKPRMTPNGPVIIAAIMNTRDVEIVDTWHTLGMRGTDSNDVAFNEVFVPLHMTYPFDPTFVPSGHFSGPLYRFPAGAIVALFSAAVLLAVARCAIDDLRELATKKTPFGSMKTLRDRGVVQSTLAEAEGILRSARALFYQTYADAWAVTASGKPASLEQRADLMLAAIHAAKSSATVTELMHRLAGTTGIYSRSRLERCFRDAHTLRHHGFVSENKLETVGQVYLGLPPDFPLIVF